MTRKLTAALALALACLTTGAMALAQGDTTGKVSIESKSVAIGVGVSWGEGTLVYRDKPYKFTVKGLSVADLGVAKVTANGDVMDLKKVEDFEGTYNAVAAGGALGAGGAAAALQNQNGVKMKLAGTGQGIKLTFATSGVEVRLKK